MTTPSVGEDVGTMGMLTHCRWDNHLGKPLGKLLGPYLPKLRMPTV